MDTNPRVRPSLSKVCLFLECQGYYISDLDHPEPRDKEFILREVGYSHWFFTDMSGSCVYSVDMDFDDLAPHNKLAIQQQVQDEHGLPFEDAFYDDFGLSLRSRNKASRDIVKLYNAHHTHVRTSIAYKGYQTGQLLKNVSEIIPVINLDMFDVFSDVACTRRCDYHFGREILHCCHQACVHYSTSALSQQWSLPDGLESSLVNTITSHLEQLHIAD